MALAFLLYLPAALLFASAVSQGADLGSPLGYGFLGDPGGRAAFILQMLSPSSTPRRAARGGEALQ